ncbi:MAG: hypothetical protein HY548_10000 [Elusimicrobia bacterium]|nr:hypothetical protein [Elusimicrobiota bacterium]
MAGIGEMVALAQAMQNDGGNPLARRAQYMISGLAAGRERRREMEKEKLDRALKILDISEKMGKIQQMEEDRTMQANVAKAMGFMPMDETEHGAARTVALDAMGGGKGPRINSKKGKLMGMYEMASPEDFAVTPSYSSKSGFSMSLRQKKDNGGLAGMAKMATMQKRVYDMATRMAITEERDRREKAGDYEGLAQLDFRSYVPSQAAIEKYKPVAERYLTGDSANYRQALKTARGRTTVSVPGFGELDLDGLDLTDLDNEEE